MPRTSNRRWKGCMFCKPHKHAGHGDAERAPIAVRRRLGVVRRWNRRQIRQDER